MVFNLFIMPGFSSDATLQPPACRLLVLPSCSRRQFILGTKEADEYEDFGIDWTARLAAGETISISAATVTLGTIVLDQFRQFGALTTFWLDGGMPYHNCLIELTATTSLGREYTENLLVIII